MAIRFQRAQARSEEPSCAYLELIEHSKSVIRGGLLVTTPMGIPKEFVYNSIQLPSGVLWPAGEVRRVAAASLAHTLFTACASEPSVLLARVGIQEEAFGPSAFDPLIPFALIEDGRPVWVGQEPSPTHPATLHLAHLAARKLLEEPFTRMALALSEVFGD